MYLYKIDNVIFTICNKKYKFELGNYINFFI